MAHHVMDRNIPYMFELFDSSDEEHVIVPPLLEPPIIVENNDVIELRMLHPVFGIMQRIEHVKIRNYIENIVYNYDNVDFIMHFRLSRNVAYNLIGQFGISEIFTSLQADNAGRAKVTAEKHILNCLWFMGHQSASYRDVSDRFGITISTLHKIITRVTNFILSVVPNIIKYPTQIEKEETASYYHEKGFPGAIGAIDGSHIRIDKPIEGSDSYINRKQYFSLHVQGTVNQNMKFIDVFVGYPGSVHDARVLKNSPLYRFLREICGDNYYLLGDSAYPCLKQLIVPYKDNGHLTRQQRTFNRKLSSCRVIVENAFGCLKQRFRQLYHFKLRDIVRMVCVIHACCVLHNMANMEDMELFEPPINDDYPDVEAQAEQYDNYEVNEYENGMHLRNEICRQL